jgi:hypothetical protein
MRVITLVLLATLAIVDVGYRAPISRPATADAIIQVDWQGPLSLPPRLRNHCATDVFSGRPYCSDHCGFQYQVYYCSPQSFGCCRVGFGYCDWNGLLRCHP